MPANLNALIRYKTINSRLFGGRRKWSIQELIDACSEVLAEARGRYDAVSERTIRDDIRIMRSDILGFNAPIKQERGLYFYSDPQFSILNNKITDAGLADKIYLFLISLRAESRNPELETILEQLCELTQRSYDGPIISKDNDPDNLRIMLRRVSKDDGCFESDPPFSETIKFRINENPSIVPKVKENNYLKESLSWGVIFKWINRG